MSDDEWKAKVRRVTDVWEALEILDECSYMFGDPYYSDMAQELSDMIARLRRKAIAER